MTKTARADWSVLIIGGGPAGTAAAIELARRDIDVLLVDQGSFPRDKTCGGCLNAAAVRQLEALTGPGELELQGAVPLRRFLWRCGSRTAVVPLPGGGALTRASLDWLLWKRAARSGAACLERTRARLDHFDHDGHHVQLKPNSPTRGDSGRSSGWEVRAKVVIVAAGLPGQKIDYSPESRRPPRPPRRSLVGIGCILPEAGQQVESGSIVMTSGDQGYVGVTRAERNRLIVAAAIAPEALRQGGPAAACEQLLGTRAAAPLDLLRALREADWRGTPPLTSRRRRLAARRLFYIGDAAAYVEPFTGEGIQWALESGRGVVPFVLEALPSSTEPKPPATARQAEFGWQRRHQDLIGRYHRRCRLLAQLLRHRWTRTLLLAAAMRFPQVAEAAVRHFAHCRESLPDSLPIYPEDTR